MSRTVVIASAKANTAIRVESFTGTTFADLKANPQFSAIYGGGEGVEVVIKPGNITLRADDSVLPTENFSAFIIATKNKAGVTPQDAKEISDSVYTAIVANSAVASLEEKALLTTSLVAAVNNVYAIGRGSVAPAQVVAQSSLPVDDELAAALAEARNM